jgi:hypothetical protein
MNEDKKVYDNYYEAVKRMARDYLGEIKETEHYKQISTNSEDLDEVLLYYVLPDLSDWIEHEWDTFCRLPMFDWALDEFEIAMRVLTVSDEASNRASFADGPEAQILEQAIWTLENDVKKEVTARVLIGEV